MRRLRSVRYSGPATDLASASLLKRASALAPELGFRSESALPRKSTPRPRMRLGRVRRQEAALAYKTGATKVRCAKVKARIQLSLLSFTTSGERPAILRLAIFVDFAVDLEPRPLFLRR